MSDDKRQRILDALDVLDTYLGDDGKVDGNRLTGDLRAVPEMRARLSAIEAAVYVMSEPSGIGWRLELGFGTREEADAAHAAVRAIPRQGEGQ